MEVGAFPLLLVGQIVAGERGPRGDHVDMIEGGPPHERVRIVVRCGIDEHFDARLGVARRDKRAREIGLRVKVDDEYPTATLLTNRCKQPHGVRLADAALQIEDRDDLCLSRGGLAHGGRIARGLKRGRGNREAGPCRSRKFGPAETYSLACMHTYALITDRKIIRVRGCKPPVSLL
jgi:hypothetical protein